MVLQSLTMIATAVIFFTRPARLSALVEAGELGTRSPVSLSLANAKFFLKVSATAKRRRLRLRAFAFGTRRSCFFYFG